MITYSLDDRVATIVLNRPERRNALSPAAMAQFADILAEFEADQTAAVAILTGAGTQAFCAGADIRETLPRDGSYIEGYFDRTIGADHPIYIRNLAIHRHRRTKPLLAAVNGAAVGGGMELALACDLCIASTAARFGLPEVRIGSIPAVGGIQRLVRSLPRAAAMQMILTGEIIDASRALEWGIVSEVVEPDQLLPRARSIAATIAANAPLAVKAARQLADKAAELPFSEAVEFEELLWGHLYASEDRIEGRRAFAEKRAPKFRGR